VNPNNGGKPPRDKRFKEKIIFEFNDKLELLIFLILLKLNMWIIKISDVEMIE
jgi:hypothetical protein